MLFQEQLPAPEINAGKIKTPVLFYQKDLKTELLLADFIHKGILANLLFF